MDEKFAEWEALCHKYNTARDAENLTASAVMSDQLRYWDRQAGTDAIIANIAAWTHAKAATAAIEAKMESFILASR